MLHHIPKVKLFSLLTDLLLINLAFAITNLIIFDTLWVDGWAYPSLFIFINISAFLTYFISNQNSLDATFQYRQVIRAAIEYYILIIGFIFIYWFSIDSNKYFKVHLLLFFSLLFLFLLFSKIIYLHISRKWKLYEQKDNYLIIGHSKLSEQLKLKILKQHWLGYNEVLTLHSNATISEIIQTIQKNNIVKVYINIQDYFLSKEIYDELRSMAESFFLNFHIFSPFLNKMSTNSKQILIGDIPTYILFGVPLDGSLNQTIKRIFDIIFSLCFISFILIWLFPIVYILINLDSKGPVFYKQKRNGLNNIIFNCFKFRSMYYIKNPTEFKITEKNDSRVTKIGKFLRKTSIDELPQFINVLFGDMSIVGPRPHALEHNNQYIDIIEKFNSRHLIKPGLTGLAQVKGYRGEVNSDEDMQGRIKFDRYYIYNWSFWFDLKIIYWTVKNILLGDPKAY